MELPEAPRLTLHTSEMHVAAVPEPEKEVTVEDMRCRWCSGFHVTYCWAIQEVEMYPDGTWSKIKLAPRPEAYENTVWDSDEFLNGLVSPSED